MTRLTASEARIDFADTLNRVAFGGERIVLRRRGKDLAALVPISDLALIEGIENEIDVREAKKVLRGMKRRGEKGISYEKARKELGRR